MKSILLFVAMFLLMVGCETQKKQAVYTRPETHVAHQSKPIEKPDPPVIYFSGKTNADLILDSVINLSVPALDLPRSARVSIGSFDAFRDAEFQEHPARYSNINMLIEDGLTMKITAGGDVLVEKDLYTLARLFAGNGNYYPNPILPHGLKAFDGLSTVDYLLSFRVLECGVRYVPLKEQLHGAYPLTHRKALTKLHLRLIDAKTGAIKRSDILRGVAEEKTPQQFLALAEGGQYRFFHYAYPARTGEAIKSNDQFPPVSERNPPEKKNFVEKLFGDGEQLPMY